MAADVAHSSFDGSARSIRGVLLDLDGVVYVGDEPLTGAVQAVRRLRDRGLSLRFVTNTSTKPISAVEAKLERLGIDIEPGEVISAVRTAVLTLQRLKAKSLYLVVDERVRAEFDEFAPVGFFPDAPSTRPDFVVVGDIGNRWDYDLMSSIFRLVHDGAGLLAVHKGRSWQTENGLALDIGAFVAGIEYAAGIEAIITGKPAAGFYEATLDDMGMRPDETIMVGDDIDSDVGGAQALGIRGVLVRTGKYREDYASRSSIVPWQTLDSIRELLSLPELREE